MIKLTKANKTKNMKKKRFKCNQMSMIWKANFKMRRFAVFCNSVYCYSSYFWSRGIMTLIWEMERAPPFDNMQKELNIDCRIENTDAIEKGWRKMKKELANNYMKYQNKFNLNPYSSLQAKHLHVICNNRKKNTWNPYQ